MKANITIDISLPIPYLGEFWFSSYGRKCCKPIKLQDSLKCNMSRKKLMMKFIFGMQMNIEVFYKLILSYLVCVTRHAQGSQNKKCACLCNIYLQKRMCDEVDFLSEDKYKGFPQADSITLGVYSQVCLKHPKQQGYNIFAIFQRNREG